MLDQRLADDLKAAMRSGDRVRMQTLRSLRAALKELEIEQRTGGKAELSEQQELQVLQRQAKQRRDSMEQFGHAGREDLVARERQELEIIEEYLPAQMSDEEIDQVLREVIASTGATSPRDLGRVMGPAMQRMQGRADGKRINEIARSLLST